MSTGKFVTAEAKTVASKNKVGFFIHIFLKSRTKTTFSTNTGEIETETDKII